MSSDNEGMKTEIEDPLLRWLAAQWQRLARRVRMFRVEYRCQRVAYLGRRWPAFKLALWRWWHAS